MIRVGIIGAGYAGALHANGYAALPARMAAVTVVADRHLDRAANLASRHGAVAVASLDEMLEAGVDAISICTSPASHAELANRAMRAGRHVLCEKPLARTLAQAESMLEVSNQAGAKLMAAHVTRFEPEHSRAREVVARGDIGRLRMASHSITSGFPDWNPHWYADEVQSGGPLLDMAIHSFDYLLWLFNSPAVRVYATGAQGPRGLFTYASAAIRVADGGMGLVETSWAHPSSQPLQLSAELVGTAGRLAWDYAGISSMTLVEPESGRQDFVMLGENSFAAQIASFVGCIDGDTAPPVPAEAGLAALRVSLAAAESAATGRAVDL